MMGTTLGKILIAGGIIAGLVVGGLMIFYNRSGELSSGGAGLGITLAALLFMIPVGVGIFFTVSGRQEAAEEAIIKKQRTLLSMVKTRGQVAISDIALELNSTRKEVEQWLHDLVGKGLFAGYVVWDEGMLYSEAASELHQLSNCRNCGGELELGGQGVIRCPYCGTDYFLDR